MAAPPPPLPAAARRLRLRPDLAARVAVVARAAARLGLEAYLVGGTVRDLLLGRDGPDLDFVTVGDGLALAQLAQTVAAELGGRLVRHPAFLTADVVDAEGVHLDLATARVERYPAMAALPEVRPTAALAEDLVRRDFTVNAMALRLHAIAETCFDLEDLIDPTGGRRDLEAGVLRPLHDRSFLDDPTRVMRGVRFEGRLGLRLAPEAEALARQAAAAGAFARLSGSRWRHELELLLAAEPVPAAALAGLERLAELGALAALHPFLAAEATAAGSARQRLQGAAMERAWYVAAGSPMPPVRTWLLFLLALAAALPPDGPAALAGRLLLAGDDLRLVSGCTERLAAALPRLGGGAAPHEVDAALAGLAGEELLLLAAEGGAVARSWVHRYLVELRPLTLSVRGADLLAAGAQPGPAIGWALAATRAARLDGEIGPAEELAYALARLAEPPAAAVAPAAEGKGDGARRHRCPDPEGAG